MFQRKISELGSNNNLSELAQKNLSTLLYSTQKRRSSDAFIFINRCFKTCAGYKNLASEVYLFLIPVMYVLYITCDQLHV